MGSLARLSPPPAGPQWEVANETRSHNGKSRGLYPNGLTQAPDFIIEAPIMGSASHVAVPQWEVAELVNKIVQTNEDATKVPKAYTSRPRSVFN